MPLMRRTLVLAAAAALAATLPPIPPAAAQPAEQAAVAKAVEDLTKAMLAADRGALESLSAEGLSYGHSSGRVETKSQFIDVIASRQTVYKAIDLSDQTISVAGDDAIVRHIFTGEAESGGRSSPVKIGVLQVWTRHDGRWKLLARQAYRV